MTTAERQGFLDLAIRGDMRARGALLDSFRPYFRFLVCAQRRGRISSRIDDSDLIQDALVEVHRNFDHFQGKTVAELRAWLRPIVLRSAGHTLRAHLATGRRDASKEQGGVNLAEVVTVDPDNSPSAQTIREEQIMHLADALARLPEDMQLVLLGRHGDGLSYAALAERLGRSEASLRVLYTRALRRLREDCQSEK
jgi:RNA polymerase sigma-70 factor (ECF subfamily)